MASVTDIAAKLHELEEDLTGCMRCGFCQAVCPLYAETGLETDVARGKLAMISGLGEKMIQDAQGVKEHLERCLLCGSCASGCPSGAKVMDIYVKARAVLSAYMGLSPLKKFIFQSMLTRPGLFNTLISAASKFQWIAFRPVSDALCTSQARFASPLGQRHVQRLAPEPLRKQVSPRTGSGSGGIRAAFYWGCLIDKIFPRVGHAVIKALDHHGVDLIIPKSQACCGMPALAAGDSESFTALVKYNLKHFNPDDFDYLVMACATCASAVKKLWPIMAQEYLPEQAGKLEDIAGKVRDISQFLVENHMVVEPMTQPAGEAQAVTYHDPCHLKKSLGVSAEPRQAIMANPAHRLVEMTEPDWCCGMGGSFNLAYYGISSHIGQRKLRHIEQTGCSTVATSCPACMLQLSDTLSQAGGKIAVKHAIEIYAESLEVQEETGETAQTA